MSDRVPFRCLEHTACRTFTVSADQMDPMFCPYCGNQSVVRVGTHHLEWADGTCPHCGGDDVDYREDVGIWKWSATCGDCAHGYAVQRAPSER